MTCGVARDGDFLGVTRHLLVADAALVTSIESATLPSHLRERLVSRGSAKRVRGVAVAHRMPLVCR